eukprot:scaffold133628_cov21-Tisochrysis_lutea.AAC.1
MCGADESEGNQLRSTGEGCRGNSTVVSLSYLSTVYCGNHYGHLLLAFASPLLYALRSSDRQRTKGLQGVGLQPETLADRQTALALTESNVSMPVLSFCTTFDAKANWREARQEKFGCRSVIMVGDGATDLEARLEGVASLFVGPHEHIPATCLVERHGT